MTPKLHLGKNLWTKFFESDDEFADFCVAPYAEIVHSDSGPSVVGRYSDEYLKCIKEGIIFVIKDEDSQVYKRQVVSKRVPVRNEGQLLGREFTVQLPVKNLEPYFKDLDEDSEK